MKKILVVEDELAYLNLLRDQLIGQGYTVIEATDGKHGLIKAKKEKPDLILLDIRMSIMDGITMLGLLRRDKKYQDAKVIMLTNLEPDDKIIEKIIKEKPLYYCVKSDVKFSDLLAKIKEFLGE